MFKYYCENVKSVVFIVLIRSVYLAVFLKTLSLQNLYQNNIIVQAATILSLIVNWTYKNINDYFKLNYYQRRGVEYISPKYGKIIFPYGKVYIINISGSTHLKLVL